MNIDIEKFYNIYIFYNNLKISGIKFCFCFISDIIEDKLENIIEEKLKLYLNTIYNENNIICNITNDKAEKENYENKGENSNQLRKERKESKNGDFGIETKKEEEKENNDFILNIIEMIKKNEKIKTHLTIITDEINKEINKFVSKKNEALQKLEQFFSEYSTKNIEKFFGIAQKIIKNINVQEFLIKRIYLNQIYFFFIFFIPNKFELNIQEIKKSIYDYENELLFDVIKKTILMRSINILNQKILKIKLS